MGRTRPGTKFISWTIYNNISFLVHDLHIMMWAILLERSSSINIIDNLFSLNGIKGTIIWYLTLQQCQKRWASLRPTYKTQWNKTFNKPLANIPYWKTSRLYNQLTKNRTYTCLSLGYFMRREGQDQCWTCGEALTVKLVILYCRKSQLYSYTRTILNTYRYLKTYKEHWGLQNKTSTKS